mgnify:CR=1 FL=1
MIRLPAYEQVMADPETYARASRVLHRESNPGNARPLIQRHGDREVWLTAPPIPLTTTEMDAVYELPFARAPHPAYAGAKIPAWEMIRHSVTIMRGCFGGCSFCSITEHEGRIIQSRSEGSILKEIEAIRDGGEGEDDFQNNLDFNFGAGAGRRSIPGFRPGKSADHAFEREHQHHATDLRHRTGVLSP